MRTRMLGTFRIFICPVLFLGANGQDLTCSKSFGSSCPTVTPLVSGPTCPDGFDQVEEHCFKVSDDLLFWDESKLKCEELNAKLAEPWELIRNSREFINYLYQFTQDNSTYEYYESKDQQFALGGKGCLSIVVWKLSGDVGYYVKYIPCNSSSVIQPQRNYVQGTHRYVCQAASEDINYSPCVHNGQHLSSGELVAMNEQQCQQSWCQAGIIKQYTCGNITNSCCEYNGKLYGDGDVIGPKVPTDYCAGCQQRVCQTGVVQWRECTNCSVKCCFFNGASYQHGNYILNTCARLMCEGTTGKFKILGIDYDCPKCKAYLDPHIVTYDQKGSSYSYQGCGNYSLSQVGSTYQPALAVYAKFEPCGGRSTLTCVGTVTFKNDEHTIIILRYDEEENWIEIQVNGEDIDMDPSSSPSIVQAMGTAYPVMAWKTSNCVNLQGSSGILVRFCGSSWANQVYVWAYPDVAGDLEGLCGSVNDDVDDDFQTREGIIASPWKRNPPVEFLLSWLATSTSNGSCDGGQVRVKRQAQPQNECDANSSVLERFRSQCIDAVNSGFSNAEPQEVQTIIDDCVFDLCNVSDPGEWIRAVQETAQVQAEIQENTLNFSMTTTTLPPTTMEPDITTVITTTTIEQSTTMPTTITTTTVEPSTTTPNTTIGCFFNGASYQPGNYILNTCAQLMCEGTTGEFKILGIDYDCPNCKVYLERHIVTYDQKRSSYSYQGCGNYSLSQVGSTYQPALAVYANFEPCGGRSTLTCVGTVTFKNDEHTTIILRYDEEENWIEIQVNGEDIDMDPSSSPSIVQAMGAAYPVMAWKTSNCVNLQGSSGILVRFCGSSRANQVYVWAYPDVAGDLEWLCSSVNDDVYDVIYFVKMCNFSMTTTTLPPTTMEPDITTVITTTTVEQSTTTPTTITTTTVEPSTTTPNTTIG